MTISEVSKKYDISPATLRYYEREGLIPGVTRNAGGIREYDEAACEWVGTIKWLRSAGLGIEALAEYAALAQQGDETCLQRRELLQNQRVLLAGRIEALQESLERLDRKIAYYEDCSKSCCD